jgi:hypothetical protein
LEKETRASHERSLEAFGARFGKRGDLTLGKASGFFTIVSKQDSQKKASAFGEQAQLLQRVKENLLDTRVPTVLDAFNRSDGRIG